MSRTTLAGAGALLAAPLLVIVAVIVQPTLSDDAGKQAAALANHRDAVMTGITLQTVSIVILLAGTIWLASAVSRRAPSLALAGGILGVLGGLVVLFEDGIAAAGPSVVHGLGPAGATAALDRIHSSVAVSGLEPLSVLNDIGLALLGIAVLKAGAARFTAVAIALGAFCESAGFGTGTKPLVIIGFAVLFAGLVQAVRVLVLRPSHGVVPEVSPGYSS